ncbi:MAG: LysM peptidoglycan-binding domain-containing protein, partial [Isosphaeraceae bacterium]
PADFHGQYPYIHTVRGGENFWTISLLYYRSGRYCKALWAANKNAVPAFDRLAVGAKILIPPVNQLDPALIEEVPAPLPSVPETGPAAEPATLPPPPPPAGVPGPFDQNGTKEPAIKTTGGAKLPAPSPTTARTGE